MRDIVELKIYELIPSPYLSVQPTNGPLSKREVERKRNGQHLSKRREKLEKYK